MQFSMSHMRFHSCTQSRPRRPTPQKPREYRELDKYRNLIRSAERLPTSDSRQYLRDKQCSTRPEQKNEQRSRQAQIEKLGMRGAKENPYNPDEARAPNAMETSRENKNKRRKNERKRPEISSTTVADYAPCEKAITLRFDPNLRQNA